VLIEIKGDKQPIGYYPKMSPFNTHVFKPAPGDAFYLFSDGYPDQIGGPKGKKMKYRRFKEVLLTNADKNLNTQKEILAGFFNDWKKEEEQIDDVLVVGIKIPLNN
jgi:serine phosphatase RsbU (regulator of sigma subunit)